MQASTRAVCASARVHARVRGWVCGWVGGPGTGEQAWLTGEAGGMVTLAALGAAPASASRAVPSVMLVMAPSMPVPPGSVVVCTAGCCC